ncbi:MAG: class II glutamine amidotransferase [Alphaproteobacteria bacterium]|nr:class II glutamine amidotransferase [Alphaproteobacteria bacterium]MBO4644056.1 class II glutamine amidotransferase [Alphaproteobacteria bacterium]
MCEIFAVSSEKEIQLNTLLKEFFSHGSKHPNGWGLAVFYGNAVSLEKEPVESNKSSYLKDRLSHQIFACNALAHIRQATVGKMEYANSHPFILRDKLNRAWTLAHNGTIFDGTKTDAYASAQEGSTDSERILYYLVDQVNQRQTALNREMTAEERFALVDRLIGELAPNNKLNLTLYDGEQLYVHTNYANSLFMKETDGAAVFATVPLDNGNWQPLPFMTPLAYHYGRRVFTGTCHNSEYKTAA